MARATTFFKQVPVAKVLKIARLASAKIGQPVRGTKKTEVGKTN
jgi:hypothetical protein